MHSQLSYIIAQQRSAELQRAGARSRLARDLRAGQRGPRRSRRTTRLTTRLAYFTGRFAPTAR